ncbi:hypothetical protein QUB56_29175 [Microcoleus sp. AR_TQ3_B6]|uniref:hypothetical protein n=1 Tax=Microcoleus sp. AR_TQ3_B6 TaxID=3055284 RepID=UPI002FD3F534
MPIPNAQEPHFGKPSLSLPQKQTRRAKQYQSRAPGNSPLWRDSRLLRKPINSNIKSPRAASHSQRVKAISNPRKRQKKIPRLQQKPQLNRQMSPL